jgi:hypothetical protein
MLKDAVSRYVCGMDISPVSPGVLEICYLLQMHVSHGLACLGLGCGLNDCLRTCQALLN